MAKNDIRFEIDQKEWASVAEMLRAVPAMVGQNAFAKSVKEGTATIMAAMKGNIDEKAKNPTGMLENSLHIKRKKKYEPMFWHSSVAVYTGKKRGEGAYYWHMVEMGHKIIFGKGRKRIDTGKKTKALEFAISAVETTKAGVLGNFASRARQAIEKAVKRRGK